MAEELQNEISFNPTIPSGSVFSVAPDYIETNFTDQFYTIDSQRAETYTDSEKATFTGFTIPVIDAFPGHDIRGIDDTFTFAIGFDQLWPGLPGHPKLDVFNIPVGEGFIRVWMKFVSHTTESTREYVTYTWGIDIENANDQVVKTITAGSNLNFYNRSTSPDYLGNQILFGACFGYMGNLSDEDADRYVPENMVLMIFIRDYLEQLLLPTSTLVFPDLPLGSIGYVTQIAQDQYVWNIEYNDSNVGYEVLQGGTIQRLGFNAYSVAFNMKKFAEVFDDWTIEVVEQSPEVGPASGEDGYKDNERDDSSDTIEIPAVPEIGVTNVGFVNVYKTGSNSLQRLGVELFPPLAYTVPPTISSQSVTDAIVDMCNTVIAWLGNIPSFFDQITASTLINYIIDCHVIPVTPGGGTDEAIKVGSKTLNVHGDRLSNDYVDVPCGSIRLAEYYASFADFLSTAKLYLPFIGFVSVRPEWFLRDTLSITYRFNVIDGSFIAFVQSTGRYVNNGNSGGTIVSQYAGNACIHLPITGVTYSNMVAGLVGAGAGAIAGAATGNIAAVATSAISAASLHGDIAQSNAYNASAAFMGCRRPFLMIERVVSDYSQTYAKENGIPSNISKKLGSVTGFAMIGDVHLDGITATDSEKAEIERLLHEGVIL